MADTDTKEGTGEGTGDQGDTDKPDADASAGTDHEAEAAKWKALARKHEAQAKSNAAAAKQLQEIEDSKKSEVEKLTSQATAESKRAEAAEARALRYEIALEKEVPGKLMKFLAGNTREEIEASADELIEAIKPADTGGGNTGKPKEALRSGAANPDAEPVEMDPAKLVADIPRM